MNQSNLGQFLYQLSINKSDIFFIQIGAGDGLLYDPISYFARNYQWSGILVEPVFYLYEKLISNYNETEKLVFENLAISNKTELRKFYYLAESNDTNPEWYIHLGSFFKNVILGHRNKILNIEEKIIETRVQCVSLERLIIKHKVTNLDLICIDTEGYDFEIIKQLDFNKFSPSIIIYEHIHLDHDSSFGCERLLKHHGYDLFHDTENTIAVKIDCFEGGIT
jgi:FkbM family methyltransferase